MLDIKMDLSSKLGDGLIFIVCDKQGGFGDLACGRRVADLLHNLGGIPADKIIINSSFSKDFERIFNTDKRYRVISSDDALNLTDVKIKIIVPYVYSRTESMVDADASLYLHEYNHGEQIIKPEENYYEYQMGFSGNDSTTPIGILIDPELHEWSQSQESKDPLAKAKLLTTLPRDFSEAILNGKSPEEFAKRSKFYLGYSAEANTKKEFLNALISLNKDDEADLVFLLPGSVDQDYFLDRCFMESNQIGQLIVYESRHEQLKKSASTKISEQGKTLTLLTHQIPNKLMKTLWKASESECLVTGDQSLTEAVSANKAFFYEVLPHKEGVAKNLPSFRCVNSTSPRGLTHHMVDVFATLRKESFKSAFELNAKIIGEQNANPKILKTVSELLDLGPKQTKILDFTKMSLDDFEPAKMIPFDIPVYISVAQIGKVKIQMKDGFSQRPDLADSKFEHRWISLDAYMITRRKKEEVLV